MMGNKYLWWSALAVIALLVVGVGCSRAMARGKTPIMSLFAFNYSPYYLDDVRVDGQFLGGVGGYTNGGSGMAPRAPRGKGPHSVRVRWIEANRYDLASNRYLDEGHRVPREAVVPLKTPYPPNPATLLLHFYADGHVEAELLDKGVNKWDVRRMPVPKEHKDHDQY
jgi:hypothetical protein